MRDSPTLRHHGSVDEEELALWWAGLPADVRRGLLDVGDAPIPEWFLANIPRGWLSTLPVPYDEAHGAPVITLDMLDPLLREFIVRKAGSLS